jgi:hypothetical protein
MHKLLVAISLVFCSLPCGSSAIARGPFPRLLPPPEDFHLTLREEPHSEMALGPSCGGEASLTLLCRAFTLTLENASKHTVHISELRCFEPDVVFEIRQPKSSSGWWPISQPGKPTCKTLDWVNIRLKPGEKTEYTTRLISPRRSIDALSVGSYTLHAHWALFGCTEASEGTDCLSPLQVIRGASTVADVALQEPVTVLSNEVIAASPPLPDLGNLNFEFEVAVASGEKPNAEGEAQGVCTTASKLNVDCTVFRYLIRNLTARPVRNATYTCSDSSIRPEYRVEGSEWKPVPYRGWVCSANVRIETGILPGGTLEGTFTLRTLRPGFDTSSLQAPGEYQFRFTFWPDACVASPDASFCLTRPDSQPTVTSKELTLRNPKL